MIKPQLDEIDLKILSCLRKNARIPLTSLAKSVGLSRGSAQDRLRRLEREGSILGYTVRMRPLPGAPCRAWFAITLTPGLTCAHVAADLLARTEVRSCYSLAGALDMLALVEASSIEALGEFREILAGLNGISAVQTYTVLGEHIAEEIGCSRDSPL